MRHTSVQVFPNIFSPQLSQLVQKNVKMAVFARIRNASVRMDMVEINARGQVM